MKTETTTTKPAFDPEVPPREGFIFYRTFYEALASMKPTARLHLYDVIMRYALYGEEPTDLNGEQMRTFINGFYRKYLLVKILFLLFVNDW